MHAKSSRETRERTHTCHCNCNKEKKRHHNEKIDHEDGEVTTQGIQSLLAIDCHVCPLLQELTSLFLLSHTRVPLLVVLMVVVHTRFYSPASQMSSHILDCKWFDSVLLYLPYFLNKTESVQKERKRNILWDSKKNGKNLKKTFLNPRFKHKTTLRNKTHPPSVLLHSEKRSILCCCSQNYSLHSLSAVKSCLLSSFLCLHPLIAMLSK